MPSLIGHTTLLCASYVCARARACMCVRARASSARANRPHKFKSRSTRGPHQRLEFPQEYCQLSYFRNHRPRLFEKNIPWTIILNFSCRYNNYSGPTQVTTTLHLAGITHTCTYTSPLYLHTPQMYMSMHVYTCIESI